MSAATTQIAKIIHERQAFFRRQMLTPTTTAATIIASHASAAGAAASDTLVTGYHCQGPPIAPGRRVSFTIPQANVSTAANEVGACGWTTDVRSDCTSKTAYTADKAIYTAHARQ